MREYNVPATYTIADNESALDAFLTTVKERPNLVSFRQPVDGDWKDVTARAAEATITGLAKGLIAQGVKAGDRVALMSSTRLEWQLADFAIWSVGAITVPVYETSSSGQLSWILEDSDAVALIVENDTLGKVATNIDGGMSNVKRVYTIDGDNPAFAELTKEGVGISDEEVAARRSGIKATDPATLIYTSGTTGRPKGVTLTHRNLVAESKAVRTTSFSELIEEGRETLMFLPLAHVLARAITLACIDGRMTVAFWGDTKTLVPQFASSKPDFILSVPRVFEKVFTTAQMNAASSGREAIFTKAVDTAIAYSKAQEIGKTPLSLRAKHFAFDKLVYGKLRSALGGKCQLAISGGAPLGARLAHFYRGVGIPVYEGYGLTESTAAVGVNTPGQMKIGTVGRPIPGSSYAIAEDGEILLKGDVVFSEYWANEQATTDALVDGWFHTGDIGTLDDEGYLTITGRKKEIIVTAGGKNVSPSGLEDVLRSANIISQAMVLGDQRPFISTLITIDPEVFPSWKESHGKPADATVTDLADDADLKAEVQAAVDKANLTVSHAEAIKKFLILPEDFTVETGELTPSLKIKRSVVNKKYTDKINTIYAK